MLVDAALMQMSDRFDRSSHLVNFLRNTTWLQLAMPDLGVVAVVYNLR
jgi:hypothetical protein